jgi:hypothetical protein
MMREGCLTQDDLNVNPSYLISITSDSKEFEPEIASFITDDLEKGVAAIISNQAWMRNETKTITVKIFNSYRIKC